VKLSLEDVAVSVGHKVFMEVDNNSLLIVGDPQRILEEQLRPHPSLLVRGIGELQRQFLLSML
jgi:hypothetical protein